MSRRLAALFLAALLGLLLVVGLAVSSLGLVPLLVYTAAVGLGLGLLVRRAAELRAARRRPAPGRTCTCCTSSVHDPVQVV